MSNIHKIKKELKGFADEKYAKTSQRFFKTYKGEYGEDDVFIWVEVSVLRKLAQTYRELAIEYLPETLRKRIFTWEN